MNAQELTKLPFDMNQIFSIQSEAQFQQLALKIFHFQYDNNPVYRNFVDLIKVNPKAVQSIEEIPFLPISFFKTHEVKVGNFKTETTFHSSGTTAQIRSKHHLADVHLYEQSFVRAFEYFYGAIDNYIIMSLLPSYHENQHSSLIYMVNKLIEWSNHPKSGFFLDDFEGLLSAVRSYQGKRKIFIIGVSYALLDLAEKFQADLSGCIVMETGGMKGRRKELTKESLHARLQKGLRVEHIHSEYGMTELLSQAYSKENQLFKTPPWMKVLIRQYNDPFQIIHHKSGGINVIDLANVFSCSFIATQDLGKRTNDSFKVLGRFDQSDLRGCNLLVQ